MSIIRIHKRTQYISINQASLSDMSMSWEAKGLHAYLLSRPDDWRVSVAHLVKHNRHAGRDKIYRMLSELIQHGYAQRIVIRTRSGRISRYDYEVFEQNDAPRVESESSCSSPLPEKPCRAGPLTVETTLTNTDKNLIQNLPNIGISENWFPSAKAIAFLDHKAIPHAFIEEAIPEFVFYWQERDANAGCWDSRFIAHATYLWRKRHRAEEMVENRPRSTFEQLSDRSWAFGMVAAESAPEALAGGKDDLMDSG